MAVDNYITLKEPSQGAIFKDKSSKFLGYAYPINSEEEVKPLIEQLKKEHHAARHWCYAWQLGVENIRYRANDDGEPSNSAGKPIYGQIISHKLTNILVVVVRYYGGINLGVGGLIQAYKTAAHYSLETAKKVEKIIKTHYKLEFEYTVLNKVMRIVKEQQLLIVNQTMELSCKMEVAVRQSDAQKIATIFNDFYGVKLTDVN